MNEQQVRDHLGQLAEQIHPAPPPISAVIRDSRASAQRTRIVLAAACAVVVATLVVVLAGGGDDGPVRPTGPAPDEPAIPGSWWRPGELHLGGTVLEVDDPEDDADDIVQMIDIDGGVVLARVDGRLQRIDADGTTTLLGNVPFGATRPPTFERDVATQQIAWTDGTTLTVYDPGLRRVVAERPDSGSWRGATAWIRAFDDGAVYWDDSTGDRVWLVGEGRTERIGDGGTYLLDAHRGDWLVFGPDEKQPTELRVDAALSTATRPLPFEGLGGPGISEDGQWVGISDPIRGEVAVVPVAGGSAVTLDLPPLTLAGAEWFGSSTLITLLRDPADTRRRIVHSCIVTTGVCTRLAAVDGPLVIPSESSVVTATDWEER